MNHVFEAVARVISSGGRAALATIVRVNGSTPQRVGAKVLVLEDGTTVGTIGGGCYENDAVLRGRTILRSGRAELVRYDLNDDFAEESGLVCGGQMDVFIEPIAPPPDLFIIGAGHVSYHLARFASAVGFHVHVIDDREKFASRERFPDAVEVVADDVIAWLERTPTPAGAYAAIVTRGHRHDLDALRALAGRDLRYLGLIGSRAKVARLYGVLTAEGTSPDLLRRVRAPIGLDLGGVTPEEIALSIVAELVAVRHGKLEGDDPSIGPLQWTPSHLGTPTPASTAFHNYGNVSAADASRLAALLVGQMLPAFSLLAPRDSGRLGARIRHRNCETQYLAPSVSRWHHSSSGTRRSSP